jgi:hypothetical protein
MSHIPNIAHNCETSTCCQQPLTSTSVPAWLTYPDSDQVGSFQLLVNQESRAGHQDLRAACLLDLDLGLFYPLLISQFIQA